MPPASIKQSQSMLGSFGWTKNNDDSWNYNLTWKMPIFVQSNNTSAIIIALQSHFGLRPLLVSLPAINIHFWHFHIFILSHLLNTIFTSCIAIHAFHVMSSLGSTSCINCHNFSIHFISWNNYNLALISHGHWLSLNMM